VLAPHATPSPPACVAAAVGAKQLAAVQTTMWPQAVPAQPLGLQLMLCCTIGGALGQGGRQACTGTAYSHTGKLHQSMGPL